MKKGILIAWILCLAQICLAQKEGNIWYFGGKAGLDFNTTPPTPLTGMLFTQEGSASIADPVTGQLLMYTDGTKVWDRNHNQMPANVANPLKGHQTSTQSALIVPQPGSDTRYYIFTVAAMHTSYTPAYPMCYSIVDLSLNGGNGDLVTWNNPLLADSTTEKLVAVGNCDRSVFWIVGHKWNCDSFFAYRLTGSGLEAPVKSKTGIVHTNHIGYMKFSPDGRKLGLVTADNSNIVELLDFDFNTGVVSNPVTDPIEMPVPHHPFSSLYGCTFSPDGSKFYVSVALYSPSLRRVFQYDMNAGSPAAILASKVDVAVQGDTVFRSGALQNGPDGKLYVINSGGYCLDVIRQPNEAGAACDYQPEAISLGSGRGMWGLPNMVESFLSPPPAPVFDTPQQSTLCRGDTAWAPQSTPGNFIIIPATGYTINADTTMIAFHPGVTTTYTVISTSRCRPNDTVTFTLEVSPRPVAGFLFNPADLLPTDVYLTLENTSTGATSYAWYDDQRRFQSAEVNCKLLHPGLGTFCYTLVAKDSIGCTDSASNCIDVTKHGVIFIPNTFSPNGDGLNDVFRIYGHYRELQEFSVYNRYGERIFYTTDKAKGWDGGHKGRLCDVGTYYYRIRLTDGGGKSQTRKGDINLVF